MQRLFDIRLGCLCCLLLAVAVPCSMQGAESPEFDDTEIVFAQSACFSGPNYQLGCQYHAGLLAAFEERNRAGGVRGGRTLHISTIDDGYETDRAAANAQRLATEDRHLAVIGSVGTPTARRMVPILRDAGIPVIGLYTGAGFLHDHTRFPNVVNLRASYAQEARLLVQHMYDQLGMRRFGVIYQDDAFGRSVLQEYKSALFQHGAYLLAKASYTRNTHAFHAALFTLEPADLDAILIIGSYAVNSELIRLVNSLQRNYVIANVSFVNSNELSKRVDANRERVVVSEVMPDPSDTSLAVVRRFHAAMKALNSPLPDSCLSAGLDPGITSFEGYVLGRFIVEALERIPAEQALTRERLLSAALSSEAYDFGGWRLQFAQGSNSGSNYVRLVTLDDLAPAVANSFPVPE